MDTYTPTFPNYFHCIFYQAETQVFDKYSRVEKAILAAVSESYLQGVSTRRVEKVITAFGVKGISASFVSRITTELDEKVEEFLSKPIEHEIPYLFIDATYLKVRDGLHYENKALFVVAGVRDDGLLEILGVRLADSEDSLFWQDLFEDLKERGLKGVKLIVSDGHKGIQKAVRESFIGSSWQMCHVYHQFHSQNCFTLKSRYCFQVLFSGS